MNVEIKEHEENKFKKFSLIIDVDTIEETKELWHRFNISKKDCVRGCSFPLSFGQDDEKLSYPIWAIINERLAGFNQKKDKR